MQDYPPRDAAYRNRLASYGENFINCAVNKENLALAGFSYGGLEDLVRCDYCHAGFKCWREGDSPLDEHIRMFPNCAFLKPLLSTPKHQEFINIRERIESFPLEQRNNPLHSPSVTEFAQCGFFAHSAVSPHNNQTSDSVACFYCGIVMARWNPGDDVWREHAIHGPDCGFVIHQKGLDFVLEANSSRNPQPSQPPPQSPHDLQQSAAQRRPAEIRSRSIGTSPITTDGLLGLGSPRRTITVPGQPSRWEGIGSSSHENGPVQSLRPVQFMPVQSSTPFQSRSASTVSGSDQNPDPRPLAFHSETPEVGTRNQPSHMGSIDHLGSSQPGPSRQSPLNMAAFAHALPNLPSPLAQHPPSPILRISPALSGGLSPSPSARRSITPTRVTPTRVGVSVHQRETGRVRYTINSRRSPIQLNQNRVSPYPSRNSINSRTPEPLPETNNISEQEVRIMYENLLRQRECKVCLVNLATVCFLPCRHLSVCPACAPQLQNCHVCRTRIERRFDVYLS